MHELEYLDVKGQGWRKGRTAWRWHDLAKDLQKFWQQARPGADSLNDVTSDLFLEMPLIRSDGTHEKMGLKVAFNAITLDVMRRPV